MFLFKKRITKYQKFLMTKVALKRALECYQYGEAKTPIPDISTLAKYHPESLHY